MRGWQTFYLTVILTAGFAATTMAEDVCAICSKQIHGTVYLIADHITAAEKLVCSNCVVLPRCFRCGLPVKDDGLALPDGRHLCARDAKVAVFDVTEARRICEGTHDDLDRLLSRFTAFPTNVDVFIIDRVDIETVAGTMGHEFESPDILGWTMPAAYAPGVRFKIGLLSGLPAASLKAISAHELSHTWAAMNVPLPRRLRMARDAEEGFCEMVAYLLMDAQNEEEQKKFILRNPYTRGQVQLFIEAEKRYGFNQILDWMKYGRATRLQPDHPEGIRDIEMPVETPVTGKNVADTNFKAAATKATTTNSPTPESAPETGTIKLQGILLGQAPSAVINGRSVFAGDRFKVKAGETEATYRCLEIRKYSVLIENTDSGKREELFF